MKIKNQTEIQLMKILFKTNGRKTTKNVTSKRAYPHGVENKYYRELKGFFKPLTDYVEKYINQNMTPLLKGDSKEIHLDAIPGDSFRNMLFNLENWLSIYMPDISDLPDDPYQNNNLILIALGKTADETMKFGEKEFQRILDKGINVNLPTTAEWWEDMKKSWMEDNYTLITSNAKNYVSKINTLTEQAIVNGLSPSKLKEEIQKATESLSDKHCKLLARDQIGKLNGQITQAQMEEVGLDTYIWSTSFDDRVRESHSIMEGLLCRWDDASVYSPDNGKTWIPRPSGAVELHPGQDIQCRCVPLTFYPELIAEMEGTSLSDVISGFDNPALSNNQNILTSAPEIINFSKEQLISLNKEFDQVVDLSKEDLIKNYLKDSINSTSLSNNTMKALFVKTLKNMKEPYYSFRDEVKAASYIPAEKMVFLKNKNVLKDKTIPIHETFHAFSELNKKYGKPLSRNKSFMKAVNDDYTKLLISSGGKEKLLNKNIIKLFEKNNYDYLPIVDIISGKQRKSLVPFLTHPSDYWNDNPYKVYDESFALIGQSIFDKSRSKVVKEFFPESFNNLKKQIALYLKEV